jgi:hypothetical protein
MSTYKVSYTKVFVPGSILEGLEYVTTIDDLNLTISDVARLVNWCKRAETKPVDVFGGSAFTVKDVTVTVRA